MIRRYAVADDIARSALVAAASSDELQAMSCAASPHWDAINVYLGENMTPPGPRQDVALALDSFAQAAIEAHLELEQRAGSG
jgi:hypothetical protein